VYLQIFATARTGPAHLVIRFTPLPARDTENQRFWASGSEILIPQESIQAWGKTAIRLKFSSSSVAKIDEARTRLLDRPFKELHPGEKEEIHLVNEKYSYQVETADGLRSSWFEAHWTPH
jgi:hypothetical protein